MESGQMTEEEKVFKDPVHGYIYVHDPVIWALINTREMQRLRRIRQLGTSSVTYPGGDHTRFSHSLGVYEVIRQILLAFERNGYDWPHHLDRLAMVSGLLHDVGHAAYSHALEKVIGMRHERWSERIILDPATEVHQVLERVYPGFSQQVADVIGKRHANSLIVSLVSGQLDADRLDYLMRDSIFTGVDYGKFDLARIIRIMLPKDGKIVVRRSGLHTVEAYLLARYFMYWQVYFHPVSRSAEVLLRAILSRAQEVYPTVFMPHPSLGGLFSGKIGLDDYLAIDDSVLMNAFNVWQKASDSVLADLCTRLVERHLFKYVEYPVSSPQVYQEIARDVERMGYDSRYYCLVDETGTVYYDYYLGEEGTSGKEGALFLWDEERGQLVEMSRLSKPISAIARERQGVRRLYLPEEVLAHPEVGPRIVQRIQQDRDRFH